MNGHTTRFRWQTQKLELHYMSSLLTLGVNGVREDFNSEENVTRSEDMTARGIMQIQVNFNYRCAHRRSSKKVAADFHVAFIMR